ncbi:alpha/beta fold hydrolase [Acidovorax sp. NCPPB 4044]|uniref:alpha/beta fold hydrolase n=1 Tax=Acidovorax sp. NCPPB 4044 TaxID=2940490 RepID=UPI002303565A|nr:alpha/beta fold hydrolase [Acidovorax sp. NCPPB 4044]MDA8519481.1 alpha/beta fold hydrolase [Acidovorax sp. NCPPB 4044]
MTDTILHALPHGITLHCHTSGERGRPVLVFLHGFPEGAFIWDGMLEHFARPENGGYRCVAPFLRGFAPSSSPQAAESYRAKHLVQDLVALVEAECGPASGGGRLAALVAHDWGGAVAWNFANQRPDLLERLVIVNSPHPGTFLRELQRSPEQQQASEYMHFLCRPDAEAMLAADGYRRLFGFFGRPDGTAPDWLTPELRGRYRATWDEGLTGPCNYYRASPLRPPREGGAHAEAVALPDAMLSIARPTLVVWGLDDPALRPGLLDGLERWVPDLRLREVPGASHWLVHEQPALVAREIGDFLQRPVTIK